MKACGRSSVALRTSNSRLPLNYQFFCGLIARPISFSGPETGSLALTSSVDDGSRVVIAALGPVGAATKLSGPWSTASICTEETCSVTGGGE